MDTNKNSTDEQTRASAHADNLERYNAVERLESAHWDVEPIHFKLDFNWCDTDRRPVQSGKALV